MVDGHPPTVNADGERRMGEARNGERGNSSFAKEKSSRGEFERPQITGLGKGGGGDGVGRLDGGFASKVEEGCVRGLGKRQGRGVNSGVTAITGMVESGRQGWGGRMAGCRRGARHAL